MTSETKKRITAINNGIIPNGYKKTKVGIVPVEWESSKMHNICEINRGASPRPIEEYLTNEDNGVNWIKIGDTSVGGKYILSTKEKIKPEGIKKSRQVFEGDFLLSNSMSYGRPYILKISGCIHDGWLVISKYFSHFDLEYFYYLLCHDNIQRQYDMLSAGSGVQNLNKDLVAQVNVIIPPLPEQQKIAEILSTQDKLIELQERKIKQLKTLKKGYLQKMFPKKGCKYPELRFKGFTDAWEQRKLGEVAKYRNGKAHENDISECGEYIVVNSKFVSTNGEVRKFSDKQIEPLYKDEIAFVLSDVPNGRAIARTFLVDKNAKYTLNQRIAGITPAENVCPYFLHILMNRNKYFLRFDDGAKQTNLSITDVMDFEEYYPSSEEQNRVGAYFENLDNLITLYQRKLDEEKQKKKALMQLLLTGKVRVMCNGK